MKKASTTCGIKIGSTFDAIKHLILPPQIKGVQSRQKFQRNFCLDYLFWISLMNKTYAFRLPFLSLRR
ncbi:hypothetical protein BGP_1713 [Beggiatoa sp. PS]|nr:hypothetical protein BGP_1713 [Beggiatoa sp. PS]